MLQKSAEEEGEEIDDDESSRLPTQIQHKSSGRSNGVIHFSPAKNPPPQAVIIEDDLNAPLSSSPVISSSTSWGIRPKAVLKENPNAAKFAAIDRMKLAKEKLNKAVPMSDAQKRLAEIEAEKKRMQLDIELKKMKKEIAEKERNRDSIKSLDKLQANQPFIKGAARSGSVGSIASESNPKEDDGKRLSKEELADRMALLKTMLTKK